jgi:hypothetical protein
VQQQDKNWIFANVSSIPASRNRDEERRAKGKSRAIDEIPFFFFKPVCTTILESGIQKQELVAISARGSSNTEAFGKLFLL